jgi:hypothetical protein
LFYVTGFTIWGAAAVTSVPEPNIFDKGLIFVKDTDILLSGDKWTIVVNIALSDYATLIDLMRSMLSQIRREIQAHKNPKSYLFDIHWEELSRLDKMVGGLEDDSKGFRKLLFEEKLARNPRTIDVRNKRGMNDILGYGLKYLFGTADARDVKRLAKVCKDLHTFEAKMIHVTEHQLTYIRTLDEMSRQKMADTVELAIALRDSVRNFSLRLNRVDADLLDTQKAIESQARYSAAIREIEMAILELKFSMTQIQEWLDVTSTGKLSSVLINPYNLSDILQQVSLQLPAGLSMLTGLTTEEMYVYYTVATVHAVATSKSVILFIDIPLKAADRYFELYQVHSLPFFHRGFGKFVMIDEMFTYLAVAETRQFFAVMTPYMLSKCKQDLYTVCPSDVVVRTAGEQSCLTALFLGKEDIVFKKCKRLVLNEAFEPVWIRSPDSNYWIYSLSTPQRVTVQCQEMGSPPNPKASNQITLEGTGILPNSSSCYIHAENFKLLPHSLGKTTIKVIKAHIVLPNIENILHSSEENLLQTDAQHPVELQHLDDIVERATSRGYTQGLDVSKVVTALRSRGVHHSSSRKTWINGIVIAFAGLGILWLIWFKNANKYCPCILRPRRARMTSGQRLNENKVELQVNLERSEENPEVTPEQAPGNESQRTVFFRHGQLVADRSRE